MKAPICFLLSLLLWSPLGCLHADEGMWMPGRLDKTTCRTMKALGLQLSPRQLYHPQRASLTDAVVSFGGFCSGVVVSHDGLVLTNHHCGFESIQQHATPAHDYLRDGFVASTREEELPNPDLYVRFLLRQEDVTRRVQAALRPDMDEATRTAAIDSVSLRISDEVAAKDSTLTGVVDAYYSGNTFWLSVYRDYYDVRLVFAPPSSVGKFGWDRDNWTWPRHTGDFCVFRIYADKANRPAAYHPDNVPYHPQKVAPLSLDGYQSGDFCMTIGYPGSTERALSSYGIEELMAGSYPAQAEVRGIKQAIWKREMNRRDSIRIKYASKYDESSNYWKYSIGIQRAVKRLHILEKRRAREQRLKEWIRRSPDTRDGELLLLTDLELAYKSRRETVRALAYFMESFLNGPELVQLALTILNFDFEDEAYRVEEKLRQLLRQYADYDRDIDREVFKALLKQYRETVTADYLPDFYQTIDTDYGGESDAYIDTLYARTQLGSTRGLQRVLESDTTYQVYNDPAIDLCIDLLTCYFTMRGATRTADEQIAKGERTLHATLRRMDSSGTDYPDANSTMRLSFGSVCGYRPADGVEYSYFTTTRGIFEKARAYADDPDFHIQPELLQLFRQGDFGRYADENGEMRVCFLTNNDITGGNSGSAIFNARGELIGLAFDGNWEAMSSDLRYEPQLQRTIGVDIRYILFLMERYGKGSHLVEEMKE